jgi:hypothetical protein
MKRAMEISSVIYGIFKGRNLWRRWRAFKAREFDSLMIAHSFRQQMIPIFLQKKIRSSGRQDPLQHRIVCTATFFSWK